VGGREPLRAENAGPGAGPLRRAHKQPGWGARMDTDTLVEKLIDDGRKLIEELPQRGFEVSAAFWAKTSEDAPWRFYIVSPVVDAEGLTKAYRRLYPLVPALPPPFLS